MREVRKARRYFKRALQEDRRWRVQAVGSTIEEGRVLASGAGRRSASGIGDTDAKDICGKATGNSGGVGGHPAYF